MNVRSSILEGYHRSQDIVRTLPLQIEGGNILTVSNYGDDYIGKRATTNFINKPYRLRAEHAYHPQLQVDVMQTDTGEKINFSSSRYEIRYSDLNRRFYLPEQRKWKLVNVDIVISDCVTDLPIKLRPVFLRPSARLLNRQDVPYLDWAKEKDSNHARWMWDNCLIGEWTGHDLEIAFSREIADKSLPLADATFTGMIFIIEIHQDQKYQSVAVTEILGGKKNRRFSCQIVNGESILHPNSERQWWLEIYE